MATRKRIVLTNNATPTNGQIPIGNGTDYTVASLTAAGGTTITNGSGSITVTTKGYALQASSSADLSPADGLVYYIGNYPSIAPSTTADRRRIYIPISGTITVAYVVFWNSNVLGTGETSTIAIRVNNTTDTTISSSVVNDAITTIGSATGLAIAVTQGDYIELKWTCPTWATNPTDVRIAATIYIQ